MVADLCFDQGSEPPSDASWILLQDPLPIPVSVWVYAVDKKYLRKSSSVANQNSRWCTSLNSRLALRMIFIH